MLVTGLRLDAQDLWTIAQTAWGEARGEGSPGIYAVAWVIRNRYDFHPRWRNKPLMAICCAPMQFSCWNPRDPNLNKIRSLSLDNREFVVCLQAAVEVMGGVVAPAVGRATHYYADLIPPPVWAEGHEPVAIVGHHRFYEGIA